ncbi:MAG: hypothetical protein IPM29_18210 [Planctomycetes bacterium]|nr:hypothetical protein [Planctomycetota bacterium]
MVEVHRPRPLQQRLAGACHEILAGVLALAGGALALVLVTTLVTVGWMYHGAPTETDLPRSFVPNDPPTILAPLLGGLIAPFASLGVVIWLDSRRAHGTNNLSYVLALLGSVALLTAPIVFWTFEAGDRDRWLASFAEGVMNTLFTLAVVGALATVLVCVVRGTVVALWSACLRVSRKLR